MESYQMQKQDKFSHIVNEFFFQAIDQEGKPHLKLKLLYFYLMLKLNHRRAAFKAFQTFTSSRTLQMD